MAKAPSLLHNHHALVFFCDTLRTAINGVEPMDLEELMEKDLETINHSELLAPALGQ